MNKLYLTIVNKVKVNKQTTPEEIDNLMVDYVALDMKEKLEKKRKQGYVGWQDFNECNNWVLLKQLRKHIEKGDMIDVINFASMIHVRTVLYGDQA